MADSSTLFLAGATASGKSEVAMILAERLGGEIISVDSMQVYRGLDIGTAKPSAQDQKRVPHHLLDVAGLHENFDAARFVRLATATVKEIRARGRRPIFCGGTGLYFKAFMEGLGDAPPANAALRAELEATPMVTLLEELHRADPATYEVIDRKNPRRVIRAMEVIWLTGKPFSAQRAAWPADAKSVRALWCLSRQTADLHRRVEKRVDWMFEHGLVDEVKKLSSQGLLENQTAMQAIGYRQVVEYLRGEHSLPETVELVKLRTRQYAKRQLTWFRRQKTACWIECAEGASAEEIAGKILA